MPTQLSLFFEDEIPIPECSQVSLSLYGSPSEVAKHYVASVRRFMSHYHDVDWTEYVSPSWIPYIKANL